jgi:hypothetical protein
MESSYTAPSCSAMASPATRSSGRGSACTTLLLTTITTDQTNRTKDLPWSAPPPGPLAVAAPARYSIIS